MSIKVMGEMQKEIDELQAANKKLKEKKDYLVRLMQDIRNCSESQQAQSLLELRAENERLKAELKKERWVPKAEGVPEIGQAFGISKYVWLTDGIYTAVAYYKESPLYKGWHGDSRLLKTFTHWKPIILPKKKIQSPNISLDAGGAIG